MPADTPDFLELVVRYFDGELSEDERVQLNDRLRASSELREMFTSYCLRSQMIRELGAPELAAEMRPSEGPEGLRAQLRVARGSVDPGPVARGMRASSGARRPLKHFASLAAAAAILLGALWGSGVLRFGGRTDSGSIATLTQTIDARCGVGSVALEKGVSFGPGLLRLQSGLVKIRFRNGTVVTLEGPAEFEILDDDLARLHSGKMTATVPPQAVGFQIDTPAMRVIDLGTSFGISVGAGGDTEVFVFEGEVEVATPQDPAGSPKKRVTEGFAVRAGAGEAEITQTPYDARQFSQTWPVNAGVLRTTGMVRFAPPGPLAKLLALEDDEHLLILSERDGVEVKRQIRVNIAHPGKFRGRGMGRVEKLPPCTRVRSYLVQFNPVGGGTRHDFRRLVGVATFERPILGIITSTKLLQATDRRLGGHPDGFRSPGRGLERGKGKDHDIVTLSDDRRTLVLDLRVTGPRVDQIRVLVDASPE